MEDITARKLAEEGTETRTGDPCGTCCNPAITKRQLIAYEIHDGLAQLLAGAIMQFQDLRPFERHKAQGGCEGIFRRDDHGATGAILRPGD